MRTDYSSFFGFNAVYLDIIFNEHQITHTKMREKKGEKIVFFFVAKRSSGDFTLDY